jgi:hypothetical protein
MVGVIRIIEGSIIESTNFSILKISDVKKTEVYNSNQKVI